MTSRKPVRRLPAKFLRLLRELLPPGDYDEIVGGWATEWAKGLSGGFEFGLLKGIYDKAKPDLFAGILEDWQRRRKRRRILPKKVRPLWKPPEGDELAERMREHLSRETWERIFGDKIGGAKKEPPKRLS